MPTQNLTSDAEFKYFWTEDVLLKESVSNAAVSLARAILVAFASY